MPFQRVPNTVQVDAVFLLFGQRVENVYHIENPTGVDAPTIDDCANLIRDWVEAEFLPIVSGDVTFLHAEARNLDIDDGGTSIAFPVGTGLGGLDGPTMPGGTAFCISLKTAGSGRSRRGRKYVMGIPRNMVVGNQVTAAYATFVHDAYQELIASIEAASKFLVVVSRFAEGVLRLEAIITRITAAAATNLDIDSQRRRLTGRGT